MIAEDFREVAHCGFRFKVTTRITEDGQRQVQIGITGSRPNAMSVVGLYVLPPGIPVGMIDIRGIGPFGNSAPVPGCLTLFLGSDSEGHFGHECPQCGGYWRSDGLPMKWPITCAYCGVRGAAHEWLTQGQRRYLQACCEVYERAINDETVGVKEIDLDAAVDLVMQGGKPPDFYYSEESQQTRFTCSACHAWNDILGRYGYCSNCGTRNDLQHLEKLVGAIRERINRETSFDENVRALVSGFDSMAQQLTKQFVAQVPLVKSRRARLTGRAFHNFKACVEDFKEFFGIDLLRGGDPGDDAFGRMMFARRHVYEHNGGVADERYLEECGDSAVRVGELLRESRENALRLATLVVRMARNLHDGFHELVPPVEEAIKVRAAMAQAAQTKLDGGHPLGRRTIGHCHQAPRAEVRTGAVVLLVFCCGA